MPNSTTDSVGRSRRSKEDWPENTSARSTTPIPNSSTHTNPSTTSHYNFKIGIYGWRKRCLYLLILGLLIMVIINLALTLWVLKVMEFSTEGMGQLRIVTGGIQLNGQAMVLDALIASTIRSRKGVPITIESSKNLTLSTRDRNGYLLNRLILGNDRLECQTRGFRITDDRGAVIFSADRREVVLGAEVLKVTGVGGVVFEGSIQTPLVRAESAHDLRLESPTRSLELRAPVSIAIESRAGAIKAQCLTDMKLQSVAGAVRLEAANVFMPNLPTASIIRNSNSRMDTSSSARTSSSHSATSSGSASSASSTGSGGSSSTNSGSSTQIFQLCVCGDGKLFLAPSHGTCSTDEANRVCR
ncbi:zeta-sarcoglycan [Chrysoperla carnea]|uniref:zeta-sarcoglycan n=1 Tax=Chrysoperla carnea TaxID=189513 RepID=UPI001D089406|nr:zeta-sarcoglycan [Chrysoperla carnea]